MKAQGQELPARAALWAITSSSQASKLIFFFFSFHLYTVEFVPAQRLQKSQGEGDREPLVGKCWRGSGKEQEVCWRVCPPHCPEATVRFHFS